MTGHTNNLRAIREAQYMTQDDLARKMQLQGNFVNIVTIRRWEQGIRFPHPSNLRMLCEILGKTAQELGMVRSSPLVREEGRSTTQHNPFRFRLSPENEQEIFGRQGLRSRILNHTLSSGAMAILDPGSYGKTWLIQGFKLAAANHTAASQLLIVQMNAKSPRCNQSMAHFVQYVFEELLHALVEKNMEPSVALALEAIREIEALRPVLIKEPLVVLDTVVDLLRAKGFLVVLCIDDLDGLGNRPELFSVHFFRALRALNQQQGGLAYLVTTRKPSLAQAIGKDAELSNFATIFDMVRLKPFHVDEARAFIENYSNMIPFSQQEQALLWQYAQISEQYWSPQLLQRVGRELYELKSSSSVSQGGSYWAQVADYLRELLADEE